MQPHARIQIFRAGTHTSVDGRKVTISAAALKEMADGYDPSLSEAPLVVGHPKLEDPAYGWAQRLSADGDMLYAEPHQVEPQFAELVNAGRYKKVSAAIYLPDSPGNPKPGAHYLKHIGFLGGVAPAVKGLRSAQFAEGDGAVEFAAPLGLVGSIMADLFQRIRDHFIERDGAEKADLIIPQWQIRQLQDVADMPASSLSPAFAAPSGNEPEITMPDQAALQAREQQLATQAAELLTREQALQARETEAQRADAVSFAARLVTEGRLLPRQKNQVVEILLALPAGLAVSFAEGDATVEKPATDALRTLLNDLPVRLDFSEKSAAAAEGGAVAFAAPPGAVVDAAGLDLLAKARAYQAEHPDADFRTAVAAVGG